MFLKLTKSEKSEYHVLNHFSLSSKKLDSFRIIKRINSLAYEVELSKSMKIHLIISIIHLEQTNEDEYDRDISNISKILKENEEKVLIVKNILKLKKTDENEKYLVK